MLSVFYCKEIRTLLTCYTVLSSSGMQLSQVSCSSQLYNLHHHPQINNYSKLFSFFVVHDIMLYEIVSCAFYIANKNCVQSLSSNLFSLSFVLCIVSIKVCCTMAYRLVQAICIGSTGDRYGW